MPDRQKIETDAAPAAIGPYSQAIRTGDLLFCSGQIPLDPSSGEIVKEDAPGAGASLPPEPRGHLRGGRHQPRERRAGDGLSRGHGDFQRVNEVYAEFFEGDAPARVAIQAAACRGAPTWRSTQ